VKCAAFELPFTAAEQYGRHDVQEILRVLAEGGHVYQAGDTWQWTSESYPADAVSLRSVSSDNFVVVDTTRGADVIGETSFTSGPATLHEKAIYMVEGTLYQVERLDVEGRKAYVREIDCDYYTDAITYTKVTVLETFAKSGIGDQGPGIGSRESEGTRSLDPRSPIPDPQCPIPDPQPPVPGIHAHGEVHVSSRVVGFKKIKFYTNENVGSGELDLPEQQMHTTAYWLTIPARVMAALPYASDDRRDGVGGLAFAMRQVAQLLLMCDRQDIGISIGGSDRREDADEPRVFIYDNYPGGIGFSEPLFGMQANLLARTRDLISGCECEHGCPTCVGPLGDTGPLAKVVALRILDHLMEPVGA
jgi:DEAD/DEAH box helicase domain-containing protein